MRHIPFGYKIEFGRIAIHDEEAVVVRRVYDLYAQSASLKSIADLMQQGSIAYEYAME